MTCLEEFIFLGTGTSGCVPNISCLTSPSPSCKVCFKAYQETCSKNKRRNTSGLIRYVNQHGGIGNVLIDCGKTFYESAIDVLVPNKVRTLDAVILTHGHADAIMGLDDLRQWTIGRVPIQPVVHVYLNQETMNVVSRAFPYMVDRSNATGGGEVAKLEFHVLEQAGNQPLPFQINNLSIIPFEVEHGRTSNGAPYHALGFRFLGNLGDFTYISDVSAIPERSIEHVTNSKWLVIDALRRDSF